MTWRSGSLWARVYPGLVSCGVRPWLKVTWFRGSRDIMLVLPGRTWQVWPPAPRIRGGRRRTR